MNIKSILLGSAAALVAVSGARAADAVVMVEPEPVEYVRVCDVYGAGFFYIPGTETCLKIGGYVRMRLEANDNGFTGDNDLDNLDDDDDDEDFFDNDGDYNFQTRVRARLNFDIREETEYGTLRAFARVQATNRSTTGGGLRDNGRSGSNAGDNNYVMDQAYIQLGGLTIGYLDSLWAERDGLLTDSDWSVGDFNQNRISYTYTNSGFSAALSVEDDGDGDFLPDFIGQLAYEGGWGSAYISGVYDEDAFDDEDYIFIDDFDFDDAEDGAFALKAGVELKDLFTTDSVLKFEGHYAFDPTAYASNGYIFQGNRTDFEPGQDLRGIPMEWQVGAGYQQTFGKLTGYLSGIYGESFDFTYNFVDYDSADVWGVAANVGYEITTNFSVLGEVTYRDVDLPAGVDDFDQTTGFLQFQRTF
jgi:hypothetical protein